VTAAPLVVDVKVGSLDDGPGLRSVVFVKGCPLRCAWCQNPETLSRLAEVQRLPARCVRCGACIAACPPAVARPATIPEDRSWCTRCGACVAACASGARRIAGEPVTPEALADRLLRDRPFFARSGGGVTLSGGEPGLFPAWCGALAERLRAAGVHVLMETCGAFSWPQVDTYLRAHVDAWYVDLKLEDPERHRRATGQGNARIHANLRRLVDAGATVLPRIPLVPGLTDDAANLRGLAARIQGLGLREVALLPYHPLGREKRVGLGQTAGAAGGPDRFLSRAELLSARSVLEAAGLRVA
jgi:pyruvate formate lyase activating enzyme